MKDVNFIRTLSPHEQRSIRRWFYITCGAAFILFLGMMCMHIPQLYVWHTLKRKQLDFNAPTYAQTQEDVKQLQEKEKTIKNYIARVEQCGSNILIWIDRFKQLAACNFVMQTSDMNTKGAQFAIEAQSLDHAKDSIKKLQACPCIKKVTLHSLQPIHNKNGYICNCGCEWK